MNTPESIFDRLYKLLTQSVSQRQAYSTLGETRDFLLEFQKEAKNVETNNVPLIMYIVDDCRTIVNPDSSIDYYDSPECRELYTAKIDELMQFFGELF